MEIQIKKALEGGWQYLGDGNWTLAHESYLLDPLFWQALGKQQGWPEHNHLKLWGEEVNSWYAQMHNFIEHIAVGGSIDDYFDKLLN